jgi:hypothetical protein
LAWRADVLVFREYIHRVCDKDHTQRAIQIRLCADDPAYFMLVFGVLYEPRPTVDIILLDDGAEDTVDRPPGWYPWVPFAFQVDVIRWFQQIMATTYDKRGRGDGILEKSRELGVSWLFCLLAAHGWLFLDDQTIMLMSKSAELVDNRGDPGSLFYKIRALVGIYDKVPRETLAPGSFWDGLRARLPAWMTPPVVQREHDHIMKLVHPSKNNTIIGETTTSTSGTGGRATWLGIDEASKNPKLKDIWGGLASVSYHRFAFSSASLEFGTDFYDLARAAEDARNRDTTGPSYYRADWWLHPLRNDDWLASERARSTDIHDFMREYEINYHAGYGDWVYPHAQQMRLTHAPYRQGIGQVACAIDPGLRDPTAMLWLQKDAGYDRHRLFEALTLHVTSAEQLAPILMGFPPNHPEREPWQLTPEVMDVMDTTWDLRERREAVLFVGDPYGNNAGGSDSTSFYDALYMASRRLSEKYDDLPPVHITVRTKYDQGARFHRKRKESLTQLLPLLDVHDTPRGKAALEAIREMRYKPLNTAHNTVNEPAKPLHSWGSHVSTAAEYYAVHAVVKEGIERIAARQNRIKAPSRRQRIQRVA